ncbi:fimbria/pilus outer membrane usher protein [Vibrio rotiferianus]|uniref:fimbria/pilus outer membrane usher protein n=1 Tax=Vibrio rotiferianus TaxID=190895 RepID=UPI0033969294
MQGKILTILSFPICAFASTDYWVIPLPIYQDAQAIGEINVQTDGVKIYGALASDLVTTLDSSLNETLVNQFKDTPDSYISPSRLEDSGINIALDTTQMVLTLDRREESYSERLVNLGNEYQPASYTPSAFWALHNHFNISHNFTNGESSSTNDGLLEWIGAVNVGGVRGFNLQASGFTKTGEFTGEQFYRGDITAFVDRPSYPLRVSAGDIVNFNVGHLPSIPMGGISIERMYSQLQPTRTIQNGGNQPITLKESANLIVYVNDIYYAEFRLPPGRYQLDDIPLSPGTNDIKIDVEYQSGQRETFVYSQFFNSRLLKESIADFGFYVGLSSEIEDDRYQYDSDEPIGLGYYEYGLNDYFTLGANGAVSDEGALIGISAVVGSPFGNLGIRTTSAHYSSISDSGYKASLDYNHEILSFRDFGAPNFYLSYEYEESFDNIPWRVINESELSTGHKIIANYGLSIGSNLDFSTGINYLIPEDEDESYIAQAQLTWSFDSLQIGFQVEHEVTPLEDIDETSFYVNISWDWYSEDGIYDASIDYTSEDDIARLQFAKLSENTPGDYGYQVRANVDGDTKEYSIRSNYVANRYTAEAEYSYLNSVQDLHTGSIRASSSLAIIDGDLGWGRTYSGPAALIKVHETLDAPVEINGVLNDKPESLSYKTISNIAPLSGGHIEEYLYLYAPEAPVGYSTGDVVRTITPGSLTGHMVHVGSNQSKTVIGTLATINGEPISLREGKVTLPNKVIPFFTNRAGRFVLEGISSGVYPLEIKGKPSYLGEIVIDETKESLIYLSTTHLQGGHDE